MKEKLNSFYLLRQREKGGGVTMNKELIEKIGSILLEEGLISLNEMLRLSALLK